MAATAAAGEGGWPSPRERRGSLIMQSGKLTPLERGKPLTLAVRGKNGSRRKKKKLVRFPQDDCEFYANIWDSPPASTKNVEKFIDIAQVAYALAMTDYKSDYEGAELLDGKNIWTMDDEVEGDAVGSAREDVRPSEVRRILSQESNQLHALPTQYKTLDRLLGTQSLQSLAVPPPTKQDNGRFVFSQVLSQLDVRDRWSTKFLLGIHEPVRHALYVIDRFLERAQSKDACEDWNTTTFFAWFSEYFCKYINVQQRIKATVLRPLVQVKYAAKREIAECYEEITFMLDAICMQEEMFQLSAASGVQSWPRHLQVLQDDIRKLNVVLHHALNLEERALQPNLIATFNEDTFHRFVMPRVYRAARPKRLVIPWIIERSKVWGGPKDAAFFRKQLSFSSRFMYDHVWYPFFMRHVVSTMKVLDTSLTDMPNNGNDNAWFGCTIQ